MTTADVAFAASKVRLSRPVTVYSKPDFESSVAFSLREGVLISVGNNSVRGFKKIRAEIRGKKRYGYIPLADLEVHKNLGTHGGWGAGGGFLYSRLSQASKSFSTSDEVAYTLSEYTSSSFNMAAFFQKGEKTFWRAYGGLRSVEFKAKAYVNVPGAATQDVEVGYRFIALGGQYGWTLFTDHTYFGGGGEFAKSISNKAKIGSQDLSNKTEAPDYFTAFGMAGAQYKFADHWTAFGELRVGVVGNQSPIITVLEVVSSVIYWP